MNRFGYGLSTSSQIDLDVRIIRFLKRFLLESLVFLHAYHADHVLLRAVLGHLIKSASEAHCTYLRQEWIRRLFLFLKGVCCVGNVLSCAHAVLILDTL